MKQKRTLKPYHGIILFLLVILSMVTFIPWIQLQWGMYGLALTELFLLVLAVGFTLLCGGDLKSVFPLKRIQAAPFFGTIIIWIASFLAVMVATLIVTYYFPEEMLGVGSGLNEVISSVPFLLSIFISAVMPAICEEAVHRGVILNSFLPIKNKWLIVIFMGILFGIFHGSIWRFLPTALLGGALSYVMLETGNMVYPALFHFINNLFPTLVSFLVKSSAVSQSAAANEMIQNGVPLISISVYVVMAAVVPFGFYIGAYLLRKGTPGFRTGFFPKKHKGAVITILTVSTVLIFAIGVVLFFYSILFDQTFMNQMTDMMKEM